MHIITVTCLEAPSSSIARNLKKNELKLIMKWLDNFMEALNILYKYIELDQLLLVFQLLFCNEYMINIPVCHFYCAWTFKAYEIPSFIFRNDIFECFYPKYQQGLNITSIKSIMLPSSDVIYNDLTKTSNRVRFVWIVIHIV